MASGQRGMRARGGSKSKNREWVAESTTGRALSSEQLSLAGTSRSRLGPKSLFLNSLYPVDIGHAPKILDTHVMCS